MVMVGFEFRPFFWLICIITHMLLIVIASGYSLCSAPPNRNQNQKFKQTTNRFWEFQEESNSWVEISLPFDLISCTNERCTKVGSIENRVEKYGLDDKAAEEKYDEILPRRKRMSLTRMSESSVWVTGQSGSIYERFWNGVKWVIAPHELPTSAGHGVSVFIVNQTILALSEERMLYQLQLNENSQPIWSELLIMSEPNIHTADNEPNTVQIKSGMVSHDGERLYFTMMNGSLLEISEIQPLRWDNNGRPPGGDVSAIADTGTIRPGVVFTVSSSGELYEFDKKSKPSWRKHIWGEASMEDISLIPSTGCTLHDLAGAHSVSLFLLAKDGFLIERRLHRRKWKWAMHGAPKGHNLSVIMPVQQNDVNEKKLSLFFTTTTGFVFEYQLSKYSDVDQRNKEELWVNHMHPQEAKVARGVRGVQLQIGRILFLLDDGRLAELHLPGIGGEASGPTHQSSLRRKASYNYEWSVLEAPETEGWNAEYCTDERGPSNCISGLNDVLADDESNDFSITTHARRRKVQEHQYYMALNNYESGVIESNNFLTKSITMNFRMRVMHADRSFFLITDSGLTFEYLYTENVWLWLRHEHSTAMKGALGSYNGSLFLVDTYGNLLIRERSENVLSWINCTAMKKGRQVATGPSWDGIPGESRRVTAEDALFFVNNRGRLLQFTVALRKFKWKDCRSPPNTRIAFIVDQEIFRMNIVFVVGRNGRLYQYNRITELWHEHNQSPHLVLSRAPGTAMRSSPTSLTGSLFMISENGVLIEYNWNSLDGWEWVEHGTPSRNVTLVGAPGPCFRGTQLFVIGLDGHVYSRHLDHRTWKWTSHAFPYREEAATKAHMTTGDDKTCTYKDDEIEFGKGVHHTSSFVTNCNEKVAPVRPLPFSEDSIIFELQDGRLAELRRSDGETEWEWTRIIGTPTSLCMTSYWTAVAT